MAHAIAGYALAKTDILCTILTDEISEGGFDFGALLGGFHAGIIALNTSDANSFY